MDTATMPDQRVWIVRRETWKGRFDSTTGWVIFFRTQVCLDLEILWSIEFTSCTNRLVQMRILIILGNVDRLISRKLLYLFSQKRVLTSMPLKMLSQFWKTISFDFFSKKRKGFWGKSDVEFHYNSNFGRLINFQCEAKDLVLKIF